MALSINCSKKQFKEKCRRKVFPLAFLGSRDIITDNTALTETEFVTTFVTESCQKVKGRHKDTEETAPELHVRKTKWKGAR